MWREQNQDISIVTVEWFGYEPLVFYFGIGEWFSYEFNLLYFALQIVVTNATITVDKFGELSGEVCRIVNIY